MENRNFDHLEELKGSDYKIVDSEPNIIGWPIVDQSGERIGKVRDMLFDKNAMKVRYIITNLKDNSYGDTDREVLIPIGKAQLDTKEDKVLVNNFSRESLASLPDYKTGGVNAEHEYGVRNAFMGTTGAAAAATTATDYSADTFYNNEDFSEDRFYGNEVETADRKMDTDYNRNVNPTDKIEVIQENIEVGKREVEKGGVRLTSRIVERPVEERVNLREEHVSINRTPVDRPAHTGDFDKFQEGTIEMRETREVPVVNKDARVVEEISLNKEVEHREEVIRDTVRHTEVDTERLAGETYKNTDTMRDGSVNTNDMLDSDKKNDSII